MSKDLQLSLKKHWFELTKSGVKTEDYREINEYWQRRLFEKSTIEHMNECLDNNGGCIHSELWEFKKFKYNIMTLGYPKSTDSDRILKIEHKGIEIRKGNPEWGAEPDKLYFVIKHGKILQPKP